MQFIEITGWVATALALVGVWLNNRRSRACFGLWLVSNAMTFAVHAIAGIWSLASRDLAFFVLAIHGWWLWSQRPMHGRAEGAREDTAPAALRDRVEPSK